MKASKFSTRALTWKNENNQKLYVLEAPQTEAIIADISASPWIMTIFFPNISKVIFASPILKAVSNLVRSEHMLSK
jgi:hypothetical protein